MECLGIGVAHSGRVVDRDGLAFAGEIAVIGAADDLRKGKTTTLSERAL